jgi:hypothetical protein
MIPSCYRKTKPEPGKTKFHCGLIYTSLLRSLVLCAGLFLFLSMELQGQDQLLYKEITISKQFTSLYKALNLVSEKADCLFIYESQVVENNKRVKLVADHLPLQKVLDNLLDDPTLGYKVVGKHILIYRTSKEPGKLSASATTFPGDSVKPFILKARVFDNENKNPIAFASIGIAEQNLGTITNTDGYFVLKVPASFSNATLLVSHIGYMSKGMPVQLINDQLVNIYLDRRIISIQEVIIRYIDPVVILGKALEQRKVNNFEEPTYLTTFYREGVQKNECLLSYSEAVFKVFKSSYSLSEKFDQVKLLKSRKIQNENANDTVFLKLKAGILAGLQLDIVKCLPDFLDPEQMNYYTFTYSDLVSYNEKNAYAISFVQNKGIDDALFTGTIYIDNESFAILGADFEVNPEYIDKAVDDLVQKKSRKLKVKFEKINYSISYTNYNGRYYLNHARSDLHLKTRFRNQFSYDHFHTFMEIATCHIDTLNVKRFSNQEVIKPDIVFSDGKYSYDDSFWSDYNIIAPEAKLGEELSKIIGKIGE